MVDRPVGFGYWFGGAGRWRRLGHTVFNTYMAGWKLMASRPCTRGLWKLERKWYKAKILTLVSRRFHRNFLYSYEAVPWFFVRGTGHTGGVLTRVPKARALTRRGILPQKIFKFRRSKTLFYIFSTCHEILWISVKRQVFSVLTSAYFRSPANLKHTLYPSTSTLNISQYCMMCG